MKFFFSTTNIPLIFALLLAALLGFVIGLALPRFRRPRLEPTRWVWRPTSCVSPISG